MRRRGRGGFSLGELVIAMGIIIIGGGLVMANCHRGYRSARAASCSSNVKQLAIAIRAYCTDWDHPAPDPRDFRGLMVYIKNTQVLVCPSQREPRGKISIPSPDLPGDTRADYLLNPQMRLDDLPGTVVVGDDMPDRHMKRFWIGARLDGACFFFPDDQWQSKLGGVTSHAPSPVP